MTLANDVVQLLCNSHTAYILNYFQSNATILHFFSIYKRQIDSAHTKLEWLLMNLLIHCHLLQQHKIWKNLPKPHLPCASHNFPISFTFYFWIYFWSPTLSSRVISNRVQNRGFSTVRATMEDWDVGSKTGGFRINLNHNGGLAEISWSIDIIHWPFTLWVFLAGRKGSTASFSSVICRD